MPQTITIDDDIYDFIASHTIRIGEDASAILRRLLDMPGREHPVEAVGSAPGGETRGRPSFEPISQLIQSPGFGALNPTGRYLAILACAYEANPQAFERLLLPQLQGRGRRYFSRAPEEILVSGRQTDPKPIPGSGYWAMCNASTPQKRRMLSQALLVLDYHPRDALQAAAAIESGHVGSAG